MKLGWLRSTLAAFVVAAVSQAGAQTSSDAVDAAKPPAGFVSPKPAAERDLSMAKYAKDSFIAGEEGVVGLRVLVRKDGSVGEVQVATSSGTPRLDQYAQDLVRDWRYQPAAVNASPVDSWLSVDVIWALGTLRFDMNADQVRSLANYYPQVSAARHEGGTSTIRFFITADGTIEKALLEKSSGFARLDDAAVDMVKTKWRLARSPAGATPFGGWFRVVIVWASGRPPENDGPCSMPRTATSPEARIEGCTKYLMNANLTGLERALAYGVRANAYIRKSEFDLAKQDFDAGIRVSPSTASLYVGRATLYQNKGQRELAFADFDAAIQVEPFTFFSHQARGLAYLKAGELDRGAADLAQGIQVAPSREKYLAYNDSCYVLAQFGKVQEGLSDCNEALKLMPGNANILDSRRYAHFKLGQYQLAIEDYDAALRANARLAASLYGRGVAKLKLGITRGQSDLDAAKRIEPGIADRMARVGLAP